MKRDFKNDLFCVLFTSFVNEKVASGLRKVEMETEIGMLFRKGANMDNDHCLK